MATPATTTTTTTAVAVDVAAARRVRLLHRLYAPKYLNAGGECGLKRSLSS